MDKKKNTILIIVILIISICVGGYFVLNKSNNNTEVTDKDNNKQKDETKEMTNEEKKQLSIKVREKIEEIKEKKYSSIAKFEETYDKGGSNIATIKNEITRLFAHLNMNIELAETNPCNLLNYYIDTENTKNGKNPLIKLEPMIMECMYKQKYTSVVDNEYGSTVLVTQSQYDQFKDYFSEVITLDKYDDKWTGYPTGEENKDHYYETAKKYLNKDYYIAYELGDGFGESGMYFELDKISMDGNQYEVTFNVYVDEYDQTNDYDTSAVMYNGKTLLEVVDNHLRFISFNINKE